MEIEKIKIFLTDGNEIELKDESCEIFLHEIQHVFGSKLNLLYQNEKDKIVFLIKIISEFNSPIMKQISELDKYNLRK